MSRLFGISKMYTHQGLSSPMLGCTYNTLDSVLLQFILDI
jgi:hypothetical protein